MSETENTNETVEQEVDQEELQAVADSFTNLLTDSSAYFTGLDWSKDKKEMTINFSLINKGEDSPSTYAVLDNFHNMSAEEIIVSLADSAIEAVKAREASEADEEE